MSSEATKTNRYGHHSGHEDTLSFDDFRRTLIREWHELKEHLLSEDRQKRLPQMSGFRKFIFIPIWLLKALFQKLNRFRQILLILSFVLLYQQIKFSLPDNQVRISMDSQALGFFILLFILMLELKDKLLARGELEAGRAVQKALTPPEKPQVPGWDIWLYTRSANEVGGDLLDYYVINSGRNGIAVGDVSDKGLAAALLMASLQATLRALAPDHDNLEELGKKVNHIFFREGLAKKFASLIYLELSAHSNCIRWINAGHLPPLLVSDGKVIELAKGEAALGLCNDTSYHAQKATLTSGEIFVLYSDGLSEARNTEGAFYGEERIHRLLLKSAPMSAEQIGAVLLQDVEGFIGDAPVHDDLTLAIIKRV